MKKTLTMVFAIGAATMFAAPAGKLDPVAEGFPVWKGVTPRNYVLGREICPSELRHRITVVVEVDPTKALQEQFLLAGEILSKNPLSVSSFGENWETFVLPRNEIHLVSVRGEVKDIQETVRLGMTLPKSAKEEELRMMSYVRTAAVPVYLNVTMESEPNVEGKYPYAYVMGPTGVNPIYKGVLNTKSVPEVKMVIAKERLRLASVETPWVPFFGTVSEDKRPLPLIKALEKGKTAKVSPLAPISKAILKDVVSKDLEKAANAQIVYDAIEQCRGDLVLRIKLEMAACPHRAMYDIQQILKYWPGEKKRFDDEMVKVKAVPEAEKLAKIFCKLMNWLDPEFVCKNAGEAKKIVGELNKMKKDLEKLKESKIVVVQNGALLMDAQVDELCSTIPMRVKGK